MKNLVLWDISLTNLKIGSEEKLTICHGHGEKSHSSDFYICTTDLVVNNFVENGENKWNKDLSKLASPGNSPVNVTFLSLLNTVCVGLANGELYAISEAGMLCELAGVCENGLLAMEWSPDQELLVLVTKELNTILMSCTFDPINEVNLLDQKFGVKQFITVGWGKKETQFHGSEGKQAAKVKTEISVDPQALSDNTIKITWRGDGHLYAIGFTMDGIRRFKVFDREGHVQYTSEKQHGLEANLSWRPSGNVIATTQKLPNKYIVAFFEKNGLKHGEFNIDLNSTTHVEELAWSSDSDILTLQCRDTKSNIQKLLLFTTSNYHWYHKQTLVFNNEQKISKIMWDNDFDITKNKKLHIILQNGQHFSYTWIWNIDHSRGKGVDDDAITTVIDGNKLLITGFRQSVVPPPMASLEIELDTSVNSVHYAPQKRGDRGFDPNSFFVCTTSGKLVFYEQIQKFPLQYKIQNIVYLNKYEFPFQYYNWYWLNSDTVVCIMVDNYCRYYLIEYSVDSDIIAKKDISKLPSSVTRIQGHPNDLTKLFLQLNNGDIIQYRLGGRMEPQDFSFSVSCPKFNVFSIDDKLHFIGLSHKGILYIDDVLTMNSVSSFYIHTHFLLLTTLQHLLFCAELTAAGLNTIIEYQKNETGNIYKRKIERGAKLVIAVPNDTRTVLQMPRGNLESIQPRPLSLKIIGEYLSHLKYHEAFDIMRKERINLNLIYDHDPDKFVEHIDVFLESVKNNSWLNLFVSDLENVDVTKTMYSSSYVEKEDKVKVDADTKIKKICDMIRENLKKRSDSDSKILPLLTTFVKKNTVEDLETALSLIKNLKLQESGGSKLPVGSDEALKYLLYMVDVNNLFDVALGMYDFDLVLLVANKSQKDPKEYIPMLNELNDMDESYKRFTINKHLKRFDRAVQCLVVCGPSRYNELRTFVKYHSLYSEALALFSCNDETFKQISDDFGLHLKLKKQFIEAGIIYERASCVDKAIDCYKDALEWELALSLAHSWPKDKLKQLCWDIVKALKEEKRHKEALTILEHYCDDCEATISFAIESGNYKTALRLCAQNNKPNLRDESLLQSVVEDYKNINELIEINWHNFIKYRDRLYVVRENKSNNPEEMYDYYAHKDSDLYSDAGSTLASSSRGSSKSFRSSKNKRKHERKVASLKEGSQYEDIALVMALHSLVTSSYDLRLQVKEMIIVLGCFGKNKEAFFLQSSLEKLLKEMKDSFKDIWTNELVIESTNASIAAQNVPEGYNVIPLGMASLEPHIRIAPVIQEINWKLHGLI